MRVALVTTEFPPALEGGAGTYAGLLADSLAAHGVRVDVFCPSEAADRRSLRVGVAPQSAGLLGFWSRLPSKLGRASRRTPFDVIHSNGIAGLPALIRPKRTAYVSTIHHVTRELVSPGMTGFIRRLKDFRGETGIVPVAESLLVRRSDRLITVSNSTLDMLVRHYPGVSGRAVVVHNGVVLPGERPSSSRDVHNMRRRFCSPDEALLLAVGRLEHRKGMDLLIRAFAALQATDMATRLLIVGSGPAHEYKALALSLGCSDRLHLIDRLTNQDLAAAYHACDIFVMPSRYEGFGLVALEAMAAAKPVVVSRTGAAMDGLIDDGSGAVVEVGDVRGITAAISQLLKDSARAARIGIRNQSRVANYTWQAAGQETINAYESAIARAANRRRSRQSF